MTLNKGMCTLHAPETLLWLVLLQTVDADDAHHTGTSQRVGMSFVSARQFAPLQGANSSFVDDSP